jgi:hypothetical protein
MAFVTLTNEREAQQTFTGGDWCELGSRVLLVCWPTLTKYWEHCSCMIKFFKKVVSSCYQTLALPSDYSAALAHSFEHGGSVSLATWQYTTTSKMLIKFINYCLLKISTESVSDAGFHNYCLLKISTESVNDARFHDQEYANVRLGLGVPLHCNMQIS